MHVVSIKPNNRKENTNRMRWWPDDVVDEKHKCRSSLGPPKLRRIGGCHARSSLRTPHAFRDAARSNLAPMCRRRYSHVEGHRLLAGLGSAAASGPRGRRRLPAQGPRCRSSSGSGAAATTPDRGIAATARRGQGARSPALGPPSRILSDNRRRRTRRR
jgi:hypothetical protein